MDIKLMDIMYNLTKNLYFYFLYFNKFNTKHAQIYGQNQLMSIYIHTFKTYTIFVGSKC